MMPPGRVDGMRLVEEAGRIGDVLEHVRRERHVDEAVAQRELVPVAGDRPPRGQSPGHHGAAVPLAPSLFRRVLGREGGVTGEHRVVVAGLLGPRHSGLDQGSGARPAAAKASVKYSGPAAHVHDELPVHLRPPPRNCPRSRPPGSGRSGRGRSASTRRGAEQLDRTAQSLAVRPGERRAPPCRATSSWQRRRPGTPAWNPPGHRMATIAGSNGNRSRCSRARSVTYGVPPAIR